MGHESVRFDRAAGYYDQTRGFPPGVEQDVAALIARVGGFRPGSHVLEVGVGTGRIALPLSRHVRAVVGIDLARPMMDQLRAKRRAEAVAVAQADATRLPFASHIFDGALAVHVFHLIPPWREVLDEIARVLAPGAALIYAGNRDSLRQITDELKQRGEIPAIANAGVPEQDRDTFLLDAGWSPLGDAQEVGWVAALRPADVLARVTQRLTSATWRMTDSQIARYGEALRGVLAERFADLDATYDHPRSFVAQAFLPPADTR
jgi:ubiquinone/menaquinone biosynthesis C-methylase UbiE